MKNNNEKNSFEDSTFYSYLPKILACFFLVVISILFFFLVYKIELVTTFISRIITILQPIIYGLVMAYLLNPIVKFFERNLVKLLSKKIKMSTKKQVIIRNISITISLIITIICVTVLGITVIPELTKSLTTLAKDLPTYLNTSRIWLEDTFTFDGEMQDVLTTVIQKLNEYLNNWLKNDLLPLVNVWVGQFAVVIFNIVTVLKNLIIGVIVTYYTLNSKETFIGQSKKIIYAIFKPSQANVLVETFRQSNKIFGGFISGKLLDSLIIGIICFIGLTILNMPYTLLVSVIVGVTNIIPFFGPYIGAIPSAFLILIVNPIQGVTFIVFITILQQIDGNIIGPKILGDSTGLSAFWVLFSILLGGGLLGLLGMIIGVPSFAVLYYILKMIIENILSKKQLPTKTAQYRYVKHIEVDTNDIQYIEPDFKTDDSADNNIEK